MVYRIEISPTAIVDVETIFFWMKTYSSGIVQIHRVLRSAQERLQDLSQLLGNDDA